jgi:hypothetical protein
MWTSLVGGIIQPLQSLYLSSLACLAPLQWMLAGAWGSGGLWRVSWHCRSERGIFCLPCGSPGHRGVPRPYTPYLGPLSPWTVSPLQMQLTRIAPLGRTGSRPVVLEGYQQLSGPSKKHHMEEGWTNLCPVALAPRAKPFLMSPPSSSVS